ncbi:MAG: WD40/YVTN/BNR-like repeat-containing protein [Acidobacteriota bacterium]
MLLRAPARRLALAPGFAAALGFLAAPAPAPGQAGAWLARGPTGGNVHCIVADPSRPSILYAGTDEGVFKSDDAGASWRSSSAGLPAERVQTIAIEPTAPATLYAGTVTPNGVESAGIFKSTDAGASWVPVNGGLVDPLTLIAPLDVEAIAVDPSHPGTLLAGSRFSEIFKSTDGGASWEPKTLGGFNVALEVSAFLFDPANPSRILAASTQGLLISLDGGENWGFYGNAPISFYALAADSSNPATLYAGNVSGSGVVKSIDGGAHWNLANNGLPVIQASGGPFSPIVLALAVDPSNPSTVYAATYGYGLFKSTDGASTWAPAGSGMRDAHLETLMLLPGQSSTLYAGTHGGGVYRSLDAAGTWTPVNAGLRLSLVSAVMADPAGAGVLYAGAFDGVYARAGTEAGWQPSSAGLPVYPVASLALSPGTPATLFAGTLGAGLFSSSDGGATWTASAQGLASSFVSSIAADPSTPSTLYAGTSDPNARSERVFKSTDRGATWTQTSLDAGSLSIDVLVVNPANPSQVAAVSQGAGDYFQSVDAGQTWSRVTADSRCGAVNTILFDPPGSTEYLGGTSGVCRSDDGGKTWTVSAVAPSASVQALLFDPTNSSILYAGASPAVAFELGGTGGVFASADGGQTWQPVGNGMSAASVTSLAIDASGAVLHAGIFGGGVADYSFAAPGRLPIAPPPPPGRHTRELAPR